MRPSLFQTKLELGATRCDICQWRCQLAPGEAGRCLVRRNIDGVVINEADELISAATIIPVEDLRMWHFFPDAQVFTVGSFGTPLRKQQNGPYAKLPAAEARRSISAERIVEVAQQRLSRGVLWTYNDPVISLEWMLDGLKLARAGSRFAAISTPGFWTPEALQAAGTYLDGVRLDMLGFSDHAYAELGGIDEWRGILAGAERLRSLWNTHIEVCLTLHRGINDDVEQIQALAAWMLRTLGSLTPLHILLPEGPSSANAGEAVQAAKAVGLKFVYGPEVYQATRCPRCTWVVIERNDGPTNMPGVINGLCESCGTPLGLRTSIFQRQTVYELPE